MRKQADGGSRIVKGLGNRRREIEDCKGIRTQEGLRIENCYGMRYR
jgi:hypothetical protein